MKSRDGEPVGVDVPSQGTQTDQRGTTAAPNAPDTVGQLNAQDRTFLLDALEGNEAEVELAADNEPALKPAHKQLQDRLAKLEGQAFTRRTLARPCRT